VWQESEIRSSIGMKYGNSIKEVTDDFMREMIAKTKNYSLVILKPGSAPPEPETMSVVWEHARRNFVLRAEGVLSIGYAMSLSREKRNDLRDQLLGEPPIGDDGTIHLMARAW
jgi:hypothetical protein